MKTLLIFLVLFTTNLSVSAQDAERCFQNDTLQGKQIVSFRTDGRSVAGTFEFENGESELAKPHKFTGKLAGNILRVKFENDELPDVAPSEMKNLNWELTTKNGAEILRIKFYGKNYETNKYSHYFAVFESCEPNYDALLKAAQLVQFVKGTFSAAVPLAFRNADERKGFLINAKQGQALLIDAAGCKISVYLPGGGLYEFTEWQSESGEEETFAKSAIDRLIIKTLPKSGNYLVILGKLTEGSQPLTGLFKIKK